MADIGHTGMGLDIGHTCIGVADIGHTCMADIGQHVWLILDT